MKIIFVINDGSPEAENATEFALLIARKIEAQILLAHYNRINKTIIEKVVVGGFSKNTSYQQPVSIFTEPLTLHNNGQADFKPEVNEIDISLMDEIQLIALINRNDIWMIIKGITNLLPSTSIKLNFNIDTILKKVRCPLLLIPASWPLKPIERMVYIADLRYCRLHIVNYLADLAKSWQADLSVAHLSAKGLPDMADNHACNVFKEDVADNVNYDRLFFNNIKEKELATALDVMINGMHNDLLVLVYHRFHFKEIIGHYLADGFPSQVTIPLLIFPY